MLLKCKTSTRYGKSGLELTKVGGQTDFYDVGIPPYYFAPRKTTFGVQSPETWRLLSTMRNVDVYRTEFNNTFDLKNFRVPDGILDDVPYDQRCAIDLPNGLFVKSGPAKHISFDMEMESKNGMFPNAKRGDRCTALSLASVVEGYKECKTIHDVPEYELLHWAIDKMADKKWDIFGGFFSNRADWPWFIDRCAANQIPLNVGRFGPYYTPYVKKRTFKSGKKVGEDVIIDVSGRVVVDVWKEVEMDQSLFGIKNHQLKTVARWFGIPVIQVDRAKMNSLTTDELRDYCLSDAVATDLILEIYMKNLVPLTEKLQIAFNMMVERSPSHISNYVYMREFNKQRILADKSNNDRYPQFKKSEDQLSSSYQGALISLFNTGLFDEERIEQILGHKTKLSHIDANSLYPSDMICFNYSPERIEKVEIEPARLFGDEDSKSSMWKDSVRFVGNQICVYDRIQGWIKVWVDLSADGVSRTELRELYDERLGIKAEIAERKAKGLEYDDLDSSQWGVKVIMNSIPGYNGMGYAKCGAFPIAAQICGLGRWEITHATDYVIRHGAMEQERLAADNRKGWVPIERDTDGLYYVGEPCAKDVTNLIRNLIPDIYQKDVIKFGYDDYDAGIFYAQKGYILLDKSKSKEKQIIYHGSGLKGRHLPKICDKALDKLVRGIFAKDDIPTLLNDIRHDIKSNSSAEDFLSTVKLSKEANEYDGKNMYGKLIQRARFAGLNVRFGDEFQIIATRNGLEPYAAVYGKSFNLDMDYYLERVASVLARPLTVTHRFSEQQILMMLKGYRDISEPKKTKQVQFRRFDACAGGRVDYKSLVIPEIHEDD